MTYEELFHKYDGICKAAEHISSRYFEQDGFDCIVEGGRIIEVNVWDVSAPEADPLIIEATPEIIALLRRRICDQGLGQNKASYDEIQNLMPEVRV